MSQHHPDPVEKNIEAHPVKLAIGVAIGTVTLIMGLILLASFAVGTHEIGSAGKPANAQEAAKQAADINQRIAPVAQTAQAGIAATTPPANAAPPQAVVPPTPEKVDGNATYSQVCAVCHGAGIAGAPKLGDKTAWAARVAQGKATLYERALKGFQGKAGVMPPKGGNPALSDANVKAAVDYMVSQAK